MITITLVMLMIIAMNDHYYSPLTLHTLAFGNDNVNDSHDRHSDNDNDNDNNNDDDNNNNHHHHHHNNNEITKARL